MKIITAFLPVALLLTGIVISVFALRYRTEKHPPIPSWNPRNWVPIWKMKGMFTPFGYRLHLIGWTIIFLTLIFFGWGRHWD